MPDFSLPFDPIRPQGGGALSAPLPDLERWPLHEPAVLMEAPEPRDEEQRKTQRRLAEIGFLPGETVRVVARGWLRGGPIAVRVGQSTFALRAHEAALLRVRAIHPAV